MHTNDIHRLQMTVEFKQSCSELKLRINCFQSLLPNIFPQILNSKFLKSVVERSHRSEKHAVSRLLVSLKKCSFETIRW